MNLQEFFRFIDVVTLELLFFAGIWFVVALFDELLVDTLWAWLRLRGKGRALEFAGEDRAQLRGLAAIFIPCWQEGGVVGTTLRFATHAWQQENCRFFVGSYPNDPDTITAIEAEAARDARIVPVILPNDGPTTKADCLNHLYRRMSSEETRLGAFRFVVLQDAEDQVHPSALALMDDRLERADFVQLPVIPVFQPGSRWISGHYADEFAENHLKTLVVRDWLRTGFPAAGVGCAFRRKMLADIAALRGEPVPFAAECLTEDYELGLLVSELGGTSRFVRAVDADGRLIATREYFPGRFDAAVRQKARWIHGIAFQGWDRLGWAKRPAEIWMRMRDRRGPLVAIVLFAAYLLIVLRAVVYLAQLAGWYERAPVSLVLHTIVLVTLLGLLWRMVTRFVATTALYGWVEGFAAIVRLPIANVITILAARRAFVAYFGSLRGRAIHWDKTEHHAHPMAEFMAETR